MSSGKAITDVEIKKALELFEILVCDTNAQRETICSALDLINRQQAEIERLQKFKAYFDSLYGEGLEIANWHQNGDLEPFDNFYDSAIEEMVGESNV